MFKNCTQTPTSGRTALLSVPHMHRAPSTHLLSFNSPHLCEALQILVYFMTLLIWAPKVSVLLLVSRTSVRISHTDKHDVTAMFIQRPGSFTRK